MKPLVLLDVDGVLADFVTPAFRIANFLTGQDRRPAELDQWDIGEFFEMSKDQKAMFFEEVKLPGFHDKIEPYPGAHVGVAELKKIADVHILTSPIFGATWCSERWRWLNDHFDIKSKDVTHSHRKELVRGDVLVDDKHETITQWQKAHPSGVGVLWHQSWNEKKEGNRVVNWDQLVEIVKRRSDAL